MTHSLTHLLQLLADSPLVHRLAWTLLHFLWQGAATALLLALLLPFLTRASARYLAATAALFLMALLPPLTFTLIPSPVNPHAPSQVTIAAPSPLPSAPLAPPPTINSPIATTPPSAPIPNTQFPIPSPPSLLLPALTLLWSLGVLFLSLYHLGGLLALHRLKSLRTTPPPPLAQTLLLQLTRRMNLATRKIKLLTSTLIHSPLVIGTLRPVILLPASILSGGAGLSAQQLEAILAHELAHIRRHDYLVNLLQALIETLLFYHPAVWWVSQKIRHERENCCDDIAAEICGDPALYAQTLLSLEQLRTPALALAATGAPLLTRIRRLLNLPAPRPPIKTRSLTAAILTLSALILTFTLIKLSANAAPPSTALGAAPTTAPATTKPSAPVSADLVLPQFFCSLTPHATRYVKEIDGSTVLTFTHNGDPKRFIFQAKAFGTDGNYHDGPIPTAVAARDTSSPLLILEGSHSPFQETTFRFDKLPLAKVVSLDLYCIDRMDDPTIIKKVVLTSSAPLQATDPGVSTQSRNGYSIYTLPDGTYVSTKGGASMTTDEHNRTIRFDIAEPVTVRNPAGEVVFVANDLHCELVAATGKPAPAASMPAATAPADPTAAKLAELVELEKKELKQLQDSVNITGDTLSVIEQQKKLLEAQLRLEQRLAELSAPSGEFYITGAVPRTGVYANNRNINILQALVAAGADATKPYDLVITLLRRLPDNKENTIRIPLKTLLDDRTTDMLLQANDVLMIAHNEKLAALLEAQSSLRHQIADAQKDPATPSNKLHSLQSTLDQLTKQIQEESQAPPATRPK